MLDHNRKITDENDLRVALCTPSINPLNNEYFAIVDNYEIEYNFRFPLSGRQFTDYESSQVFNQSFNVNYTLKFQNCIFNNDIILYFHQALANRDIIFDNCTFNKNVSITSYENNILFHDCTFNGVVDTKNAIIKGKVRFRECNFVEQVNFNNTRFEALVDFWRCQFQKKTIFYKTDLVFSAATFKENVLFTYTLINKLILLRGTKIEKGFDISLAIIHGKLGLFEFKLQDFPEVDLLYDEDNYEDAVSTQGIIPINNKRETFRILKDNLESQKNLSESLKFKKIEKEVLRRELSKQSKFMKDSSVLVKINNFLDQVNLGLNKLSNDHGNSYGRAFIFTVVAGWIFFYLSLLVSDQFYFTFNYNAWNFNDGFILFIEFLNPLHKLDYIDNKMQSNVLFYIVDFFGKMIVGYGIYQFVQAFRKYK